MPPVASRASSRGLPRTPWPLPPRSQRSSRRAGLKDYAFCISRLSHTFILHYFTAPKTRIPLPLPSKSRQPSPVALLTPHRERWRGANGSPGALPARSWRSSRALAGRFRRACRSAAVVTPQEPVTLHREHVLQTVGEAAANALHIERAIDVARDITHALFESRPRF